MDGDLPPEIDCGNDGFMDTECDYDGDGIMDFVGGSDCDDWDPSISSLDLDDDGFSGCDGDCWDSAADTDGDGVVDSAYTYPGAAYNEDNFEDCMTDADGDGYGDMNSMERKPVLMLSPGTLMVMDGMTSISSMKQTSTHIGIIYNEDLDGIAEWEMGGIHLFQLLFISWRSSGASIGMLIDEDSSNEVYLSPRLWQDGELV